MDRKTTSLARQILALDAMEFRELWQSIGSEMMSGRKDLEMEWYRYGKDMQRWECSVISTLHSAVISGQRNSRRS
ncbi:hypothetical protein [Limimaricola pyoseonensis]|uniref:Uncharacterized protein n=1 Tax=Limimaricola pyoseonensis TaxID=521013 RepID=A0A1G7CRQ1_9RHOB|nr:hypothetical protein [Limimaricola pyoseonensis]SDE41979.1 hypothetical protein SAMN04488567_1615 [Limimaricola pyoseonensis]